MTLPFSLQVAFENSTDSVAQNFNQKKADGGFELKTVVSISPHDTPTGHDNPALELD